MDFFTANDAPVRIAIDDKPYDLPRFLLPAMKEWGAALRKETADLATADLDPDQKARFLTFFQPPKVDILQVAENALTPEGADYVCRAQMKKAGVADDVVENLMTTTDPLLIRKLADELTTASRAKARLETDGNGEHPLSQPPVGSAGSAETSARTTQPSGSLIPA